MSLSVSVSLLLSDIYFLLADLFIAIFLMLIAAASLFAKLVTVDELPFVAFSDYWSTF